MTTEHTASVIIAPNTASRVVKIVILAVIKVVVRVVVIIFFVNVVVRLAFLGSNIGGLIESFVLPMR